MAIMISIVGIAGSFLTVRSLAAPPPAPPEMETFAFLLGKWQCKGSWRQEDESASPFEVTWWGRKLLDGHAQVEEYRAQWPDGETFVYGLNYRMFDPHSGHWTVDWHSALDGSSFNLGQPTVNTSANGGREIIFIPGIGRERQRAIFKNISANGFTWQGDWTVDGGESWDEAVMVIHCNRAPS